MKFGFPHIPGTSMLHNPWKNDSSDPWWFCSASFGEWTGKLHRRSSQGEWPKAGAVCGWVLEEKEWRFLHSEQLCGMCPSPKIMILNEEPAWLSANDTKPQTASPETSHKHHDRVISPAGGKAVGVKTVFSSIGSWNNSMNESCSLERVQSRVLLFLSWRKDNFKNGKCFFQLISIQEGSMDVALSPPVPAHPSCPASPSLGAGNPIPRHGLKSDYSFSRLSLCLIMVRQAGIGFRIWMV